MAPSGLAVRPTPDRVREALFDILGAKTRACRFLDLFAGSGANGIEAFSRGAEAVVMVESGREALRSLETNLRALDLSERIRVVRAPWPLGLGASAREGPFTIVFADPPYAAAPYAEILASVSAPELLAPDGLVVLEHEARAGVPEGAGGLQRVRIARYGRVGLAFFAKAGPVAFPETGN